MHSTYIAELIDMSKQLTMRGLLLEIQHPYASTRYRAVLLMEFKKRLKYRKPLEITL